MKFALINPNWTFEGSIYFGCREPHLPLEYGYAKVMLEREGHEVRIIDAQLHRLTCDQLRAEVRAFAPKIAVLTTAPSYLFWRCAPPELRVPQQTAANIRDLVGILAIVGPHGSTTPGAALRKLQADVVVLGECEEVLPRLLEQWRNVNSIAYIQDGKVRVNGSPHSCDMGALPAPSWSDQDIRAHQHHHHRFDAEPLGPGAEIEYSRGCPYTCTFCAKQNFRDQYRKRPLRVVLEELDRLIEQGVEYVYFIDEIFLPVRDLLEALVDRPVKFGIQTRIDLWKPEMIDLLGRAGCVSVEAGVESITEEGRAVLDKRCRMTTDDLAGRLIYAKDRIPFVQANLLEMKEDDPAAVEAWRLHLIEHGVWANKPVPLFVYPGSPEYKRTYGLEDDHAWERAHGDYLQSFDEFSDVQEQRPSPLVQLELPH